MTLHVLNDAVYDAEPTQISIITLYLLVRRVNQLGKMINTRFASIDIKLIRLDFENAC